MPKNNYELLAGEKRTALVTAAIALFSEKPFDEITLEDITGSLGLSSASFYRYFKDKEDLLLTALNHQMTYDELSDDFIRNRRIPSRSDRWPSESWFSTFAICRRKRSASCISENTRT